MQKAMLNRFLKKAAPEWMEKALYYLISVYENISRAIKNKISRNLKSSKIINEKKDNHHQIYNNSNGYNKIRWGRLPVFEHRIFWYFYDELSSGCCASAMPIVFLHQGIID